jgi:hypothetical protein
VLPVSEEIFRRVKNYIKELTKFNTDEITKIFRSKKIISDKEFI